MYYILLCAYILYYNKNVFLSEKIAFFSNLTAYIFMCY